VGLVLVLHSLAKSSPDSLAPCGRSGRLLHEVVCQAQRKNHTRATDLFFLDQDGRTCYTYKETPTISRGGYDASIGYLSCSEEKIF
jgi:hypothetical protein